MSDTQSRLEIVKKIAVEIAGPNADKVDRESRFPTEAIEALKKAKLMSALVPVAGGGMGVGMIELAAMCETLGQHCASAAMVFAMHQIQVACIVRHAMHQPFYQGYVRELLEKQNLIASVTSEVGVGGEMRTSICGVERQGDRFTLVKDASTISYGAQADDLLVTARRAPDAPPNDQVAVLVRKADYTLEQKGAWDTLGMRGTCSPPFKMSSKGVVDQIMTVPFSDVASHTMVPFSHVLWASCWLGIATSAVSRARAFVRAQARQKPGAMPPTALRLAEAAAMLQAMRTNVRDVQNECEELMKSDEGTQSLSSIGFSLKMNNLKVTCSQQVTQIVQHALLICGIMGYKNDSPYAVGRHLRDGHSAALMVGNDRIYGTNASMLLVLKDD
ncbi:MAG TPA: acyl-CoA dehydrogenase family protein [Polyangiaceae bacterium]|nr:acyl-CoA dehydrogenase family protein [Polyangiaceae bacterium]